MTVEGSSGLSGVRLLSHRPSVLSKLLPLLGTDRRAGCDIAGDGLEVSGPDWEDRLKDMLAVLSSGERAGLFAIRLDDEFGLPLPSAKVLARARTDWFPQFLSHGTWVPNFQPIVDFASGRVVGREVLMRGRLGTTELRGEELVAAAEAHDAIYSWDRRARMVALENGLPLLAPGEILCVNLDPRAVVDVENSVNSTWTVVERVGAAPASVCLELVSAELADDLELLGALAEAHRERGASIALDDLSGSPGSLACLEAVRPDMAKLDTSLVAGIERSASRRRLAAALVESAHELGAKVVAEGVEQVQEYEAVRRLGVDYGQGYYFGHPTERPMAVDPRVLRRGPSV